MEIYKITNVVNGKVYIGKNLNDDKNYFGSGKLIKNAIRKYGKDNFIKEVLEKVDNLEDLNDREKHWISNFNSITPIGYNISMGGDGGDTFTNHPDKEKLREIKSTITKITWQDENYRNIKSNISKNLWLNEEYRTKVLEKRKNRIFSDETKKKISESNKKPKSDSHKMALSIAWQKRKVEHPHTHQKLLKK